MLECSSCNSIMELITTPKVDVLQCVTCGFIIEMPRKKEKKINYNDLIITKIPRTDLLDIIIV
jgi:Zn ribbon nucleic-acid-binding protein